MNLKITIDRFEGDKVVLKTADNETLVWPKDKLPENIHEGMVLEFTIDSADNAEKNEKLLAKKILNEILKPE